MDAFLWCFEVWTMRTDLCTRPSGNYGYCLIQLLVLLLCEKGSQARGRMEVALSLRMWRSLHFLENDGYLYYAGYPFGRERSNKQNIKGF